MVLIESSYHLKPQRDQRDDMGPLKDALPFELQRPSFIFYFKSIGFSMLVLLCLTIDAKNQSGYGAI